MTATDKAIAVMKDAAGVLDSLREQNKALLEALRRYVDTDGYHDDITVQGEAAIAQAEQRGGSRKDGPLLEMDKKIAESGVVEQVQEAANRAIADYNERNSNA